MPGCYEAGRPWQSRFDTSRNPFARRHVSHHAGSMANRATFDDLVAEGAASSTDGWDFSWLDGRATEERPPWGFVRILADRLGSAAAALDIQTGGGEVLAEALANAPQLPAIRAATEGWGPNAAIAMRNLRPFGVSVEHSPAEGPFPFPDASFDLVTSRHPVAVVWDEITRVLDMDGTYLAQHVGAGSNRELTEFMMGPQAVSVARSPDTAVLLAESAGLVVVDLRQAVLRTEFYDIGAVTYFLRKVLWTVPGFTVEAYRDRLAALHEQIEREGPFVSHATRYLIEARRILTNRTRH